MGESERVHPLQGERVRLGRAPENDIRLADPSVSRFHAVIERSPDGWLVRDLGSTNGTRHNGARVERAPLAAGDRLVLGTFDLAVEVAGAPAPLSAAELAAARFDREATPTPVDAAARVSARVAGASIVRPLADFTVAYGLAQAEGMLEPRAERSQVETAAAYGDRIFGLLTRLAQLLITAESVDAVLARVLEIVFEALPVERGFILLQDADGELVCELARLGERLVTRPEEGVPVSATILETVIEERVALLTFDALADHRLAEGESIRIHGIRAAMSAPLWSGERIIGVLQVDTPAKAGVFGERDLDLLTAVANYGAVAVERLRNAEHVAHERRLRSRLERYHSPGVIEEMLREAEGVEGGGRPLRVTEASVLFADLVGFTAFAERADPQDVAALLGEYFDRVVEIVFAAGGTLDKFIGDAVMAFFGAPMAQPDHAERAVAAAREVRRAIAAWGLERSAAGLPLLSARIAINSGPVVVGEVGSRRRVDYTVLGNTVNVAARLEQLVAGPGEIVLGDATQILLAGSVPVEPLGEIELRGLAKKVRAWRVASDEDGEAAP